MILTKELKMMSLRKAAISKCAQKLPLTIFKSFSSQQKSYIGQFIPKDIDPTSFDKVTSSTQTTPTFLPNFPIFESDLDSLGHDLQEVVVYEDHKYGCQADLEY